MRVSYSHCLIENGKKLVEKVLFAFGVVGVTGGIKSVCCKSELELWHFGV